MVDPSATGRSVSPFKQTMLGGYDREEVDDYVTRLEARIEELERQRSPDGAVQRALEQVGDEVSGILQRAHETAAQLTEGARGEAERLLDSSRREAAETTESSRREADALLENARRQAEEQVADADRQAAEITAAAEQRLQDLDVDADRIWSERERILADLRFLAHQLIEVADEARSRFPVEGAAETEADEAVPEGGENLAAEIGDAMPGEIGDALPGRVRDPLPAEDSSAEPPTEGAGEATQELEQVSDEFAGDEDSRAPHPTQVMRWRHAPAGPGQEPPFAGD